MASRNFASRPSPGRDQTTNVFAEVAEEQTDEVTVPQEEGKIIRRSLWNSAHRRCRLWRTDRARGQDRTQKPLEWTAFSVPYPLHATGDPSRVK